MIQDQSIRYPMTIEIEDGVQATRGKDDGKRKAWHQCPQQWVWVKGKTASHGESAHKKIGPGQHGGKESLGTKMPRMSHRHPRLWLPSSVTDSMHS